ncbi:MAG: CaiB/BaiF CoA-transferase family protein [Tepidiformaceae bacterium]
MTPRPRALDVSAGVGAAYASKLLAEAGWDVVKHEPPGGDPLRARGSRWGGGEGGAFSFVNQGKRGVSLDEPSLRRLAGAADAVLGDFSPAGLAEAGLPADAYQTLMPRFVVTSLSGFGLVGPKAGWASTELIVQAASGLLFLTGEWDQPPMQLPPYQGALTGGVAAACATLAAMLVARRDNTVRRTDVSMVEAMAMHTFGQQSAFVYFGEVPRREARIKGGLRMVPASDRFVYCAPGAVATMRMDGIAVLLDEPELADERFQTAESRMANYDQFVELFVPPFRRKSAQEWFEEAEKMHMTFALVQSIDDLFACPQLDARQLLREVTGPRGETLRVPGRTYRLEGGPTPVVRPAPARPGIDNDDVLAHWLGGR